METIKTIKNIIKKWPRRAASVVALVLIGVLILGQYVFASGGIAIRTVHKVEAGDSTYCFSVERDVLITPEEIAKLADDGDLTRAILDRAGIFMNETNCKSDDHPMITMKEWLKKGNTLSLSEDDIALIRAASPEPGKTVKLHLDVLFTLKADEDKAKEKGDKPSEEPSDDPGGDPGTYSGDDPVDDPSDDPGVDPGDDPGDDPGNDPGDDSGDNPGADPGDDSGDDPGDDPGNAPGDDPGDNPGDNPGDAPGDDPGDNPGDDSGDAPGDDPGDAPGDNPGDDPGDNPGDDSGNAPGDAPGDNPGDDPGDNPGDDPGDAPGDDPGDDPCDDSGDDPGDDSGDDPGDDPGDEQGDDPGDDPSYDPGDDPEDGPEDSRDDEYKRPVYSTYKLTSPELLFIVIATDFDSKIPEECEDPNPEEPEEPELPEMLEIDIPEEPGEILPEFREIEMVDKSGKPVPEVLEDGEPVDLTWIEPEDIDIDTAKSWIEKYPGGLAGIGGTLAALGAGIGIVAYIINKRKEDDE